MGGESVNGVLNYVSARSTATFLEGWPARFALQKRCRTWHDRAKFWTEGDFGLAWLGVESAEWRYRRYRG